MKTFAVLLVLLMCSMVFAQPQIIWNRTYDAGHRGEIDDLLQTADSGYITVGLLDTVIAGVNRTDLMAMKLNSDGVVLRHRRFHMPDGVIFDTRITQQQDGPVLKCGIQNDIRTNCFLIGLNGALDSIWSHIYDFDTTYSGQTWIGNMARTPSGFAFPSLTIRWSDTARVQLVRTDLYGDTLWVKRMTSEFNYIIPCGAYVASDGNLLFLFTMGNDQIHVTLYKTDMDGNIIWTKAYYLNSFNEYVTMSPTRDGGWIIAGAFGGWQAEDGWLLRLNSECDSLWCQTYGGAGAERFYGVVELPDGGFVAAGSTNSVGGGGNDGYIVRTDPIGRFLWSGYNGLSNNDMFWGLTTCIVGGFTAGGTKDGSPWLIHYGPDTTIGGFVHLVSDSFSGPEWPFVLEWGSGRIPEVIFSGYSGVATGRTSGAAFSHWTAMSGGDGNDGDSIIFHSEVPLESGSLDTFWVTLPDNCCSIHYTVGCRSDSIPIIRYHLDSLSLAGVGVNGVLEVRLRVVGEQRVGSYEILRAQFNGAPFAHLTTFIATNQLEPHTYSFRDSTARANMRYLAVVEESGGCRYEQPGSSFTIPVSADPIVQKPISFGLSVYPNPFNPTTTLSFTLPKSGVTSIVVYDIMGRQLQTLQSGVMEAGEHQMRFDGSQLPSGLYFARFQSGEFNATQKLLLLK